MRVVLDTNVLLSALISHRSAPRTIYEAWLAGKFELLTSEIQLDEVRRVSRYPRMRAVVKPHVFGALVNDLRNATMVDRLHDDIETADPDDAFLLAMAEAGKAAWLVTGDKRAGLLQRGNYGSTRIGTARAFVAEGLGVK